VLAHGFFGFNDFAGAGFLTYFYNVKDHLESSGEVVYTPAVDPFNSSDFRGEQLVDRIEAILDETGHAKVNLIGHSQGGLDARVVANLRPDLVASVITIGTPHNGSPIADVVLDLVSDPNAQQILSDLVSLLGAPLYDQIGNETDVIKPLKLFSQPGIAEFNMNHPDEPGIFYASVAGRSDYHSGGAACTPDEAVPFITAWENEIDPIDPLLLTFEAVLDGNLLEDFANDGLVRVKDARRGKFWGCLPSDHTDQVGQIFGDSPGILNSWSYLDFYSALVAELRYRGL
jgi:triacylglycerol lipase